ncbi:MAG: hypothetical protein K8T90_03190 [Planctomycetes bacterium]|nr:hypothetical protein [Planctomycetota bacterium]
MSETTTDARTDGAGHVSLVTDDYLAGRLESDAQVAFEAHLIVCDRCFSAYLLRTLDDF